MATRRDFFKQFVGQLGVLRDDLRGVENIPLNRLRELPHEIIEHIVPVFFPDVDWHIEKNEMLIYFEGKSAKDISIKLNAIELNAIELFKNNIELKNVAIEISKDSKIPFDDIYQTVTSLFFKLASLRICHPYEVYRIDKIIKANKEQKDE